MNIKNIKLKNNLLITLLIFIVMTVLPVFISSLATKVNGYSFKSISKDKTWNTSETIGGIYEFLYNKTTGSNPSIPTYNQLRDAGYGVGTALRFNICK